MGYRDSVNLTGCIATERSSGYQAGMMALCSSSYAGHRFLVEVIAHIVWLSFRFPFSLRMVEEMSAARGILVSHETMGPHVRPRDRPRQRLPRAGGKWRLDENSGVAAVEL